MKKKEELPLPGFELGAQALGGDGYPMGDARQEFPPCELDEDAEVAVVIATIREHIGRKE